MKLQKQKAYTYKGKQKYKAQILGCDTTAAEKIKDKVDAYLYIGTGKFHPIALGSLIPGIALTQPYFTIRLRWKALLGWSPKAAALLPRCFIIWKNFYSARRHCRSYSRRYD